MSGFEWFLVIVVVFLIPLAIAVVVTLWTLEMARRRNPRNRPGGKQSGTKRRATREPTSPPTAAPANDARADDDADVTPPASAR